MDRFKHIVENLCYFLVYAAMGSPAVFFYFEGLDGSVESIYKKHSSQVLGSEEPIAYLWQLVQWFVIGICFAIASMYSFYKAWWHKPRP